MLQIDKIRLILLEEFIKAQAKNPSYSMRAYSKRIGVSQAAISEVLAGKRPLTKKTAQKILWGLDKSPNEISQLVETSEQPNVQKFKSLDMDTFHLISEWHYFAILSLTETKDFKSSPAWVAERLGLSKKVAEEALERLLRLGMLGASSENGRIAPYWGTIRSHLRNCQSGFAQSQSAKYRVDYRCPWQCTCRGSRFHCDDTLL